jgi:two-component system, NtrC family, response regulator AtoC
LDRITALDRSLTIARSLYDHFSASAATAARRALMYVSCNGPFFSYACSLMGRSEGNLVPRASTLARMVALRILVISQDSNVAVLTSALQTEGHHITLVADPEAALSCLWKDIPYDSVLFDTSPQSLRKLASLEALAKACGSGSLWMLAPLGMDLWRTDATRLGIRSFLHKPLQRHDLDRIVDSFLCSSQNSSTPALISPRDTPGAHYVEELSRGRYFLAASSAMKKIYSTIRLLAPVDVPVLLLGESGVGKDIVANLLHKHSTRAQQSYISLNCAALPSELLESELFGYEAGAFTGAVKAKPGRFEMANHGTLLLDEIGEMSAPMQAKLLHVLQDGCFSRLGSRASSEVDVRVVAATNVNIAEAIAKHAFREDLYYRISAFTIVIPPLRERREEIPFLLAEMLCRQAATLHQQPPYLAPQLLDTMQEYDWPGNLRELSNFVMRILILQDQNAVLADLLTKMRARYSRSTPDGMRTIVRNCKDQAESRLIQNALDQAGWNRRHAAASLKISYRGLLYKIQQYQLQKTGGSPQLRPSVEQARPN